VKSPERATARNDGVCTTIDGWSSSLGWSECTSSVPCSRSRSMLPAAVRAPIFASSERWRYTPGRRASATSVALWRAPGRNGTDHYGRDHPCRRDRDRRSDPSDPRSAIDPEQMSMRVDRVLFQLCFYGVADPPPVELARIAGSQSAKDREHRCYTRVLIAAVLACREVTFDRHPLDGVHLPRDVGMEQRGR
jgi:hypothetical protein